MKLIILGLLLLLASAVSAASTRVSNTRASVTPLSKKKDFLRYLGRPGANMPPGDPDGRKRLARARNLTADFAQKKASGRLAGIPRFNLRDVNGRNYCMYKPFFEWSSTSHGSNSDFFYLPSFLSFTVTTVKDQSYCGSCVAFATVATLEASILYQTGTSAGSGLSTLPDFSEKHLYFCVGKRGCDDGWWQNEAADAIVSDGAYEEQCLPYSISNFACGMQCGYQQNYFKNGTGVIEKVKLNTWEDVKAHIVNYGPVTTSFSVYEDFGDIQPGKPWPGTRTNKYAGGHAVSCHGFDDYMLNGVTATSTGVFFCKNSWGEGWNGDGFFMMAYGADGLMSGYNENYGFKWTKSTPAKAVVSNVYLNPSEVYNGETLMVTAELDRAATEDMWLWTNRGDADAYMEDPGWISVPAGSWSVDVPIKVKSEPPYDIATSIQCGMYQSDISASSAFTLRAGAKPVAEVIDFKIVPAAGYLGDTFDLLFEIDRPMDIDHWIWLDRGEAAPYTNDPGWIYVNIGSTVATATLTVTAAPAATTLAQLSAGAYQGQSNQQTALEVLPGAARLELSSVSVAESSVQAGDLLHVTFYLVRAAEAQTWIWCSRGEADPYMEDPGWIVVEQGATEVYVNIIVTSSPPTDDIQATLSAGVYEVSVAKTTTFTVLYSSPAEVSEVYIDTSNGNGNPAVVPGNLDMVASFDKIPGSSFVVKTWSSNYAIARDPSYVDFQADGAAQGTYFTVVISQPADDTAVTIRAFRQGSDVSGERSFTVLAPPAVQNITAAATSVSNGQQVTFTLKLARGYSNNVVVALTSSNPKLLAVPASVSVGTASGILSTTFKATAGPAASDAWVVITAKVGKRAAQTVSVLVKAKVGMKGSIVTASKVSGVRGAKVNLVCYLKSGTTALSGKTLSFTVGGVAVGSAKTDGSGKAVFSYKVPFNSPATSALVCNFVADGAYLASKGSADLAATAAPLTITITALTVKQGKTAAINAVVSRSDGVKVGNLAVAFKVNGVTKSSAFTNGQGVAVFNWAVPKSQKAGNYKIEAVYGGNAMYKASSGTGNVKVTA